MTDFDIALSGVVIAGVALILSGAAQIIAWSDRRLNRMPHLRIWLGTEEGGYISFGIANDGFGAAIIEEFQLTVDGQVVPFHMLLTALLGEGATLNAERIAPPPNEIGQQSTVELLRIGSNHVPNTQLMNQFGRRVGVSVRSRPLRLRDKRSAINLQTIIP